MGYYMISHCFFYISYHAAYFLRNIEILQNQFIARLHKVAKCANPRVNTEEQRRGGTRLRGSCNVLSFTALATPQTHIQ